MTSIIRTFLSSLSDLKQAQSLVTPDAVFVAVRAKHYPDLPIYGTFTGYAGLGQFVEGLRNTFDTQRFHVDDVVEEGALGAAFGRFEHRVRANGRMFRSRWAVMCRFQDGKIAFYRFFEDTAALEEALECRTVCQESIA